MILSGIIILGILAQWTAWRLKLPAILPLILIGLAVGPISSLYTDDGSKLLEPMWNGTKGLFPGETLFHFVSLAISIILFEGGLTLKRSEIPNVGKVIIRLIIFGSLITFFGAAIACHYTFGLPWNISFLFSALIIVTGPTVITPILRNISLKRRVSSILKWEGILIDPIGALIAVLVFEFINIEAYRDFTIQAFVDFSKVIVVGTSLGFSAAYALSFIIKKHWVPHYLQNVVSLCCVLIIFVFSDILTRDSGLLSVVIMGMVMGNLDLPNIKELLYFKESLSLLLISILFILLAANINMEDLYLVYNWNALILFAFIILLIRPIAVFLSTINSKLNTRERLFISWVGPRGIVSAGIASLFGIKLVNKGEPYAQYIVPLVFMIVLGTVLLNATTARAFAKIIGVFIKHANGVLIVGFSLPARVFGEYLKKHNRYVVFLDSNLDKVKAARDLGFIALHTNIFTDEVNDVALNDIGYVLALTSNGDANKFALNHLKDNYGKYGAYRFANKEEFTSYKKIPLGELVSDRYDSKTFELIVNEFPAMGELVLKDKKHYQQELKAFKKRPKSIPIAIRDLNDGIHLIHLFSGDIDNGYKLAYIGEPIVSSQ